MTMHLVRGMSSLNTKSRKKKQKINWDQLELEWRQYNKDMRRKNLHSLQFSTLQDYIDYKQGKVKKHKPEFKQYTPKKESYTRDTKQYASLKTSDSIPGYAPKKEPQEYTGTLIKGIATMHKSNAVPVIDKEQATEIANMRRN